MTIPATVTPLRPAPPRGQACDRLAAYVADAMKATPPLDAEQRDRLATLWAGHTTPAATKRAA